MKKKMSAKTFIRALAVTLIVLWAAMGLYLISRTSSRNVEDYFGELKAKEEGADSRALELVKTNPHSRQLIDIDCYLCQLKVCQKDYLSAVNYLSDLFAIVGEAALNNWQKSNLYLFGGNIYRDCGKFDQAQECYRKSLSTISMVTLADKCHVNTREIDLNKAISLNNLGIVYYLLGESGVNKQECKKSYSVAKDYFEQAKILMCKNRNNYMVRTITNNMEECLIALKFLD